MQPLYQYNSSAWGRRWPRVDELWNGARGDYVCQHPIHSPYLPFTNNVSCVCGVCVDNFTLPYLGQLLAPLERPTDLLLARPSRGGVQALVPVAQSGGLLGRVHIDRESWVDLDDARGRGGDGQKQRRRPVG